MGGQKSTYSSSWPFIITFTCIVDIQTVTPKFTRLCVVSCTDAHAAVTAVAAVVDTSTQFCIRCLSVRLLHMGGVRIRGQVKAVMGQKSPLGLRAKTCPEAKRFLQISVINLEAR